MFNFLDVEYCEQFAPRSPISSGSETQPMTWNKVAASVHIAGCD